MVVTSPAHSRQRERTQLDVEEAMPVAEDSPPVNKSSFAFLASLVLYGLLYIGLSCMLIFMNKYLMTHDRFPYALPLVTLHQLAITIFSGCLFACFPKMYPTAPQVRAQKWLTFRTIFPLSVCCAASFVASNLAYKYVSVALLQILKEANIAGVFFLSLCTGLEIWNWKIALVLLGIVCFTAAAVTGDIHFVWYGIVIQLVSQLFECFKIIIMQCTMSNRPGASMKKLDPLTAVGLMAPIALCLLCINVGIFWDSRWPAAMYEWRYMLLANCVIAFALNIAVMKFIQVSTGIHFVLCGILKDIMIVVGSGLAFGQPLTAFQYLMFVLSTAFIILHSIITIYPNEFAEGWGVGCVAFFTECWRRKSERYETKRQEPALNQEESVSLMLGREVSVENQ